MRSANRDGQCIDVWKRAPKSLAFTIIYFVAGGTIPPGRAKAVSDDLGVVMNDLARSSSAQRRLRLNNTSDPMASKVAEVGSGTGESSKTVP